MRWFSAAALLIALQASSAAAQVGPCSDSLYTALKRRPLDSLSTREYAAFAERDRACLGSLRTSETKSRYDSIPVQKPADYKDPTVATLLGFVLTGGGQMYAGRETKGTLLLLGAIGSAAAGVGLSTPENTTPLYIGSGLAAAQWLYGLISAGDDARRHNTPAVEHQTPVEVPGNACSRQDGAVITAKEAAADVYVSGASGCQVRHCWYARWVGITERQVVDRCREDVAAGKQTVKGHE